MSGEVKLNIGCNYEDFLRGLATVKKEADLAVLEQRKKDQAARDERRAAERADREAKREAENAQRETARAAARAQRDEEQRLEREKRDAAQAQKKQLEQDARDLQRQIKEKEKLEKEAAREAARVVREEEKKAEREKQEAARAAKKQLEEDAREIRRQIKEKEALIVEANRNNERQKKEAAALDKKNAQIAWQETLRQQRDKEKAQRAAQQSSQAQTQGKVSLAQGAMSGGVSGVISAIGMMFGPWGMVAAEAINMITAGVGELISRAREFRNLSYATGLSTKELMKLESVAEATGVSLQTLSSAFYEFNKRMATAQIRGGEFNAAAGKLGLDMNKLKDRTLTAQEAMIELAKAHKAGTDAATLAYYGNMLFGSSFEQLLPAIRRGTADMIALSEATIGNSETATRAMGTVSDYWNLFWANFKAASYEYIGQITNLWVKAGQVLFGIPLVLAIVKSMGAEQAARALNRATIGSTDEEKMRLAQAAAKRMSKTDAKTFMDEFKKILGEGGTKLNPFGLQSAQGASQLQQMGGGDIVGAIAFTPLERIALATEQTAQNTKPDNSTGNPVVDLIPLVIRVLSY
jgi:chemotaxis protein histidine kinase CheA